MELYLVENLVELVDLEKAWAPYKKNPYARKPSSYQRVDLKFPSMVKPVVQSKSNRQFVGKLRDVIKRDYEQADADFEIQLIDDEDELMGNVDFRIGKEKGVGGGFYSIFGESNDIYKIWMTLSLGHVATEDTPVSPDTLFVLRKCMDFQWGCDDTDSYGFVSGEEADIEPVRELWSHQTGFIYTKLTIVLQLSEDAVGTVMRKGEPEVKLSEVEATTRKMLEEEICTDMEIRCVGADGGIVKGHRGMLGARSEVFRKMFLAEGMEEARTGRVEVEEMSEQGVRAFLRWVYWRDEREALEESDVAVEMLIAGDKYGMEGLVGGMREIILERRGCDEMWFGVEGAVRLYAWARDLEGLKEFKEKAIDVLKFFGRNCPEKLEESGDYQELIKSDADAKAAMQLSQDN